MEPHVEPQVRGGGPQATKARLYGGSGIMSTLVSLMPLCLRKSGADGIGTTKLLQSKRWEGRGGHRGGKGNATMIWGPVCVITDQVLCLKAEIAEDRIIRQVQDRLKRRVGSCRDRGPESYEAGCIDLQGGGRPLRFWGYAREPGDGIL